MTHYAELIEYYGPLRRHSTLHMERVHQFLLSLVNESKNCINTIYSMMKYHREHIVSRKLYEETFKSQPVKNGDKVPCQKRPFKLNCRILRNVHRNGISTKQYFHAKQFSYCDGQILAKGVLYEIVEEQLDLIICDVMKHFVFPLREINDDYEIKMEELFYENNYLFFVSNKPLLNKSTAH